MKICDNVLELIGNTPMVRINNLLTERDATLLVKLEWYNPGGSVKDRMAKYLIEYAEASGKLDKDKVILEATSGNTGIALAMIAAVAMALSDLTVVSNSLMLKRFTYL